MNFEQTEVAYIYTLLKGEHGVIPPPTFLLSFYQGHAFNLSARIKDWTWQTIDRSELLDEDNVTAAIRSRMTVELQVLNQLSHVFNLNTCSEPARAGTKYKCSCSGTIGRPGT